MATVERRRNGLYIGMHGSMKYVFPYYLVSTTVIPAITVYIDGKDISYTIEQYNNMETLKCRVWATSRHNIWGKDLLWQLARDGALHYIQ